MAEYRKNVIWNPKIRAEFAEMTEPISIPPFVHLLGTSIARIHCKVLASLTPYVEEARDIVEPAFAEAETAAGAGVVRSRDPDEMAMGIALVPAGTLGREPKPARLDLQFTQLPVHLVRTATRYLSDNAADLATCDEQLADDSVAFGTEPYVYERPREPDEKG